MDRFHSYRLLNRFHPPQFWLNIFWKFTGISVKIKLTEHQTMTFLQNNLKPGKKSWKFDNYSHFFIVTHYTAMHISGLFSTL